SARRRDARPTRPGSDIRDEPITVEKFCSERHVGCHDRFTEAPSADVTHLVEKSSVGPYAVNAAALEDLRRKRLLLTHADTGVAAHQIAPEQQRNWPKFAIDVVSPEEGRSLPSQGCPARHPTGPA